MRFNELHLIKYGRFDDCKLIFPKQAPDLHVVFGPNEAGKTTTLFAVRDLLFGFGRKTDQAYRFDRALLRVGANISSLDGSFTVRRKKGDVRTLLDENDNPAADNLLTPSLAGYDASSFERMFSLDHKRLRDGGQAILDAEDDVGQAIFAAGAGLSGIAALCETLDDEAKGIWTRNAAQSRRYYVAQRSHDEAKARLRDALVRPARWEAARRRLQEATTSVEGARVGTHKQDSHGGWDVIQALRQQEHGFERVLVE